MKTMEQQYFEWLCDKVVINTEDAQYSKLLSMLYDYEFVPTLGMDENRVEDGVGLIRRFSIENNISLNALLADGLTGLDENGKKFCSVLEMMVALAIRCEESIMTDNEFGDRTNVWFNIMIDSLGLNRMYNKQFKVSIVSDILERFVNNDYEYNGEGGLFTIKRTKIDMRKTEIWYQMCWYLDTII